MCPYETTLLLALLRAYTAQGVMTVSPVGRHNTILWVSVRKHSTPEVSANAQHRRSASFSHPGTLSEPPALMLDFIMIKKENHVHQHRREWLRHFNHQYPTGKRKGAQSGIEPETCHIHVVRERAKTRSDNHTTRPLSQLVNFDLRAPHQPLVHLLVNAFDNLTSHDSSTTKISIYSIQRTILESSRSDIISRGHVIPMESTRCCGRAVTEQ